MNTVKIDKKATRMVAHRGLSGIETENTNAAFIAAANRSYYGIETDIHKTKDGSFVLIHDATLERVGGESINVEEVSLSVSKSVTLFDKDGTKQRGDLAVSTLNNYVNICKKYEKHCVLELKSEFTAEEIERIIEIIKELEYLDGVTFISFKIDNLIKVRELLPHQSIQYLFSQYTDEKVELMKTYRLDADIAHSALTKERIDELHKANIKVNCWTVDNKERAEELVGYGVDFITTNILE